MIFLYITLFAFFFTLFYAFIAQDKRKVIIVGSTITLVFAVLSYWWNPRDLFTTAQSLKSRAVYNQTYAACRDSLDDIEHKKTLGYQYGIITYCQKTAESQSGYKGDEKSILAPFQR